MVKPRQLASKRVSWCRLDHNIRHDPGDEDELRRTGRSYFKRPIHPIICRPDGTVIDGARRIRGMLLEGKEDAEVDVLIVDEDLTPQQIAKLQFLSAVHRADLPPYDKCMAAIGFKDANPGMSNKQLAEEELDIDPSMLTRLLALKDCVQQVQQALKEEKIGIKAMYEISKEPSELQPAALAVKLNGVSAEELGRQGRKRRTATFPTVRAGKVKVCLSSGTTVTLSGRDLSLLDVVEELTAVLKEAKDGVKDNLDVKTWQAVMRDKAEAGV
jgi:ParB-like chromosome segregation protein Spo0J